MHNPRTNGRRRRLLAAAAAAAFTTGGAALAQTAATSAASNSQPHVLYVESNIATTGDNSLFAFQIASDSSLHALTGSPFSLKGTGFYDSSFRLGPFDNDQNVIIDGKTDVLYAVNGGSNTIAALHLDKTGKPHLLPGSPFRAYGSTPVSIGLHDNTLLAIDSSEDPAQAGSAIAPRLNVFRAQLDGPPVFDYPASYAFPAGAQPTQALTKGTGPFVFSPEFPSAGVLRSFYQDPVSGRLSLVDTVTPPVENGTQAEPLGLSANPNAPYLYVGFVTTNQLGVYQWDATGHLHFIKAAADSGQAICWVKSSRDGKILYAINTGDHSVSVFDTSNPANPTEIQHVVVGGVGGLEEFSLDPEEHFLYVVEQENNAASVGKSGKIFALKVDPSTGKLSTLPNDTVTLPLPAHTRPIGVAIR